MPHVFRAFEVERAAVVVEGDVVRQRVLLDEVARFGLVLLLVDAQGDEARRMILEVERDDRGCLLVARRAPRREEVEIDRLAA